MALGRNPYQLAAAPVLGADARRSQQPERVVLGALIAAQRSPRAVERIVVPKRSLTYFGATRPARAPRLLTMGRANTPSEQLRQTLVARTRYLQSEAARAQAQGVQL